MKPNISSEKRLEELANISFAQDQLEKAKVFKPLITIGAAVGGGLLTYVATHYAPQIIGEDAVHLFKTESGRIITAALVSAVFSSIGYLYSDIKLRRSQESLEKLEKSVTNPSLYT